MFFLGVLFMPRIMMLWLGAVQPGSVQAILGFSFAPRIMICLLLAAASDSNSGGLIILWLFAIVLDIAGLIFKSKMAHTMWQAQKEAMAMMRAAGRFPF